MDARIEPSGTRVGRGALDGDSTAMALAVADDEAVPIAFHLLERERAHMARHAPFHDAMHPADVHRRKGDRKRREGEHAEPDETRHRH